MSIFQRRSIQTRVTLLTVLVFLAGIWSLALYAGRVLQHDMQRMLTEQQFSTVSLLAAEVNQEFEQRLRGLHSLAAAAGPLLPGNQRAVQAMLEQRPTLLDAFNGGVVVVGIDGVAVADAPATAARVGVSFMDADAVAAALRHGESSVSRPAMDKKLMAPVFGLAVPVRDGQGRVTGAVYGVVDLGLPNFLDKITSHRYGKSGDYFLAALRHRLNVVSSDKSRVMQALPPPGTNPFIDRFVNGYEGSASYVNQHGVDILVSVKGVPSANWAMVATLPTVEAYAPIQAMQRRILAAALLLTVAAGGLIWWVTWWMLRRELSPMLAATRTLSTLTEPGQRLTVTRHDEIGELLAGFNSLLQQLAQRERELRDSRERFDLAVQGSSDGIWDWDIQSGQGYVSDRWWALLGYARGERTIGPTGWLELVHPDDLDRVQAQLGLHLESRQPYAVEFRMRHKSGDYRWYLARGQAQWGPDGKATRMAGSTTDITERRQAEDALRQSEAYNKVLFAGSHIALAVLDPETGRLVDCNQAIVDIYRLESREAVLALTPADVGAPTQYDGRNTAETAFEPVAHALRKGSHVFEWRHQRPDGEIWDAEVHLMSFQHGGKTLMQFSLQDITARKRAEADLRIAATAFESQEGMIITDIDQKILRINGACSQITGYNANEVVGRTPRIFSSGRHDAAFYRDMWASIQDTGAWEGELWNRRKSGEVYPEWFSISAVKGADGKVTHYVASFIDISQRKTAEDEIKHLAFYDPLTRLPNRRLLMDRLRHALVASARSETAGALFFIDLDNFKTLNDTLGHDKGDLLLQSVATRLSAALRAEDTVARLGGDEFVVMMEGLSLATPEAADQARQVAEKILAVFRDAHDLAGLAYPCSASIGIALFTRETGTVEDLLKYADLAMYQAKAAGRNTLRFFDPEMQSVVMARAAMEAELREALQHGQLLLHYQPQVDVAGRIVGAEALVRWQHPARGLVPPMEFIGLAEETGLISPLGNWVLQAACRQLVSWAAQPELTHVTVAVNVSAHQLRQPDFVAQVLSVLQSTGANPCRLKLELTESLLVSNVEDVIEKMMALKAQGVGFSLDDFGTGYSSLSYLRRLPLDQLKIDQSFVRDILDDPNDAAIARTIVALARSLGLGVIAEGVETEAQRDFLQRSGCEAYQGYLFSRPLPVDAFEGFAQQQ